MVAPHLDTEHPGIRVIAEVASVLQAGSASGVALRGVVGALRRGLNLRAVEAAILIDFPRRPVAVRDGDDERRGAGPPRLQQRQAG